MTEPSSNGSWADRLSPEAWHDGESLHQRAGKDIEQGIKPMTNTDYKQAVNRYLIPLFDDYHITKTDSQLVKEGRR
jgi:hypothetical protein